MKTCSQCSRSIQEDAAFCPHCGAPVPQAAPAAAPAPPAAPVAPSPPPLAPSAAGEVVEPVAARDNTLAWFIVAMPVLWSLAAIALTILVKDQPSDDVSNGVAFVAILVTVGVAARDSSNLRLKGTPVGSPWTALIFPPWYLWTRGKSVVASPKGWFYIASAVVGIVLFALLAKDRVAINIQSIEDEMARSINQQTGTTDARVNCPNVKTSTKGQTMVCTVTAGGQSGHVGVTFSDGGDLEWRTTS